MTTVSAIPNLQHIAEQEKITLKQIRKLQTLCHFQQEGAQKNLQKKFEYYFTLIPQKVLVTYVERYSRENQSDTVIALLLAAIDTKQELFKNTSLKLFVMRCKQLRSCNRLHGMSLQEIFRAALFIEKELVDHLESTPDKIYFKKDLYETPRTLFYQKDTALYLVNKGKVDFLDITCGFKRVSTAVRIPLQVDQRCTFTVQAVNLVDDKTRGYAYPFMQHEIKMLDSFRGSDKIIQMLFAATYRTWPYKQAAIFFPYYEMNLDQLVFDHDQNEIEYQVKLQLAEDILVGLNDMHTKKTIHGDVKPNNVMLYTNEFDEVRAVLIDLGYSTADHRNWDLSPFHRGLYGSPYATSPEVLLSKTGFTGDVFKAEMWAVGHLFYQLYFRQNLPWAEHTKQYLNKKIPQEELAEEILTVLDQFARKQPADPFLALIYDLLHPTPNMRPDTTSCLACIREIRNSLN